MGKAQNENPAVQQPDSKKAKTESDAAATASLWGSEPAIGIVNAAAMSKENCETLRRGYVSAEPYLHTVIRDLFQPEMLDAVREEIIHNIQATYKETDLFKVFQTGDLGNLDRLDPEAASKLPTLMRLKTAVYSDEFRSFVQEVTGCGELATKTDCSCNVYAKGGHLLCHDDVIATRRVSWIIYLSHPEDGWSAEDGGGLELYPLVDGKHHTPATEPTLVHLPIFNTMAMFTVLPGKSFHAVQEVFADDKPRMSISGWYHAPHEPEDKDKASLQQLQAGEDAVKTFNPFNEGPSKPLCALADGELSDEDLSLLIRFINPTYLSEDSWPRMQAKFEEDGSIQLHNFLKKSLSDRVSAAAAGDDKKDQLGGGKVPEYSAGLRDGWRAVGPPHKQRYTAYEGPASAEDSSSCGPLLAQIREELFTSGAFARLLRKFTTITFIGQQSEVRRFRPGLDYTVAHYGILTKDPRLDVVLCFVGSGEAPQPSEPPPSGAGKPPRKGKGIGAKNKATKEGSAAPSKLLTGEDAWEVGEVGGFEAYLLAEEDDDGAKAEDTYRVKDAEESGVLNVSPAPNSLSLVLRDEGLMKFLKYVSYAAPSSRWDIAAEFQPEDDSDDEEEEVKEE